MKRFVKVLGIIGAIGAIVWAMRDRFISLTVPKEPEPPAFRNPPPPPAGTSAAEAPPPQNSADVSPTEIGEPDDLTAVKGIGPVFAERLSASGITTFAELAETSEERLAEVLGSRLGNVGAILEDARRLAGS